MKTQNTSLVIAPAKMTPKPTRAEIIEAAVEVRVQELQKQSETAKRALPKKREAFKKRLLAFVRKLPAESVDKVSANVWCGGFEMRVNLPGEVPPDIEAMRLELSELCSVAGAYIDRNRIKEEVRRNLSGVGLSKERVQTMISDKATREALLELTA